MVFYSSLEITSSDIGAAVAECIIEDIRVNGLGLGGFPQVSISRQNKDNFKATLNFNDRMKFFHPDRNRSCRSGQVDEKKQTFQYSFR